MKFVAPFDLWMKWSSHHLLEDLNPEGIETYLTLPKEASNRNGIEFAHDL